MRFTLAVLAIAMTLPPILRPPKPALAATPAVEQALPDAHYSGPLAN